MFKHYFLAFAKNVSSLLMKIPARKLPLLYAILREKQHRYLLVIQATKGKRYLFNKT